MAYYITKSSLINGITMYYEGSRHWSDQPDDKKTFTTHADAQSVILNDRDGRFGFTNAEIVYE